MNDKQGVFTVRAQLNKPNGYGKIITLHREANLYLHECQSIMDKFKQANPSVNLYGEWTYSKLLK